MYSEKRGKIASALQAITIIPLFVLGFIITLLGTHQFTLTMHTEIEVELSNIAHNMITLLDVAYPGDYILKGESAYQLYKGNNNLTWDYSLIDRVKEDTGMDITLFYQDTRILTTICDSSGERIVGTGAPEIVIQNVLEADESHFYNNIIINGSKFFAYYMPLHNSNGDAVGMIFVGKPSTEINLAIQRSVYPLIIAEILAILTTAVFILLYTKRFVYTLAKIQLFLSDVSSGNLNAELDFSVLIRNDELGNIGRSALTMQRSLRNMVELDTLTELPNRRSGNRRLQQAILRYVQQNTPYCIALGDIDFFKKVNDTYGHDCGDIVLKNVAEKLRNHMFNCGYAIRWGGEEFLLIFERSTTEDAQPILENLLNDIRSMNTLYEGELINVTMTFGLVNGGRDEIRQLIRLADEKLYEGKTNGKNRIIT